MKILTVDWTDTAGHSGAIWQEEGDVPKPVKCRSVGYLLRDRKRYLVLALTVTRGGWGTMAPVAIPKACITKVRRLK